MKKIIQLLLVLYSSFYVKAQGEQDSIYFFDYSFNCAIGQDVKWSAVKSMTNDTTFIVELKTIDTSRFLKERISDKYTITTSNKFTIHRSFSKYNVLLPEQYQIEVEVKDTVNDLYVLNLFSDKLNLFKTVYSKTLVPICPIEKTVFYHHNNLIAEIYYHYKEQDSIWNSRGEFIHQVYTEVDSMPVLENYPTLPYVKAMNQTIVENISYPETVLNANISGKVYISFIITSYGEVEHVKVIRSVHPSIDNEAINLVKNVKIKSPALDDGKPVDLRVILPIDFNVN